MLAKHKVPIVIESNNTSSNAKTLIFTARPRKMHKMRNLSHTEINFSGSVYLYIIELSSLDDMYIQKRIVTL